MVNMNDSQYNQRLSLVTPYSLEAPLYMSLHVHVAHNSWYNQHMFLSILTVIYIYFFSVLHSHLTNKEHSS